MADLTKREAAILAGFRRVFGDDLAAKATELITNSRSSTIGMADAERKERERRAAAAQQQPDPEEQWWNK